MWKKGAFIWGTWSIASTGGVDRFYLFYTRCCWDSFYPQGFFHKFTIQVELLFIPGVDVRSNIFDNFCRFGLFLDHLFNALDGVEHCGVVTVFKFTANFL